MYWKDQVGNFYLHPIDYQTNNPIQFSSSYYNRYQNFHFIHIIYHNYHFCLTILYFHSFPPTVFKSKIYPLFLHF